MDRRHASLEDVAADVGVSSATVSRALRGFPNVAPSTRERVEAAARRLNYRVDPAASRLARGRSSTVAMVVAVLDSWYFSSVMAGAEAVLAENGYELAMFVIGDEAGRERLLSSSMLRGADGVILVDVALDSAGLVALVEQSGPTVTVGLEFDNVPSVVVDDRRIGHMATTHLLTLGHTAIGLLGGTSTNPLGFAVPDLRREGYLRAMQEASVEPRPEFEASGNFSVRGGYEAMSHLLVLDDRPTAVFAMSDEMAFGAIKAVREHGLRIPEDVSIVGVDDHPLAWVEDLTTVQQEVNQHGAMAAQMVLGHIEKRAPTTRIEVHPTLTIRGSSARAV